MTGESDGDDEYEEYEDDFENEYDDDEFEEYDEDEEEGAEEQTACDNPAARPPAPEADEGAARGRVFIPTESNEALNERRLRTKLRMQKWKSLIVDAGEEWQRVGKRGKVETVKQPLVQLKLSPLSCLLNLAPLQARELAGRGLGQYAAMDVRATQTDFQAEQSTQANVVVSEYSTQAPEEFGVSSRWTTKDGRRNTARESQSRVMALMSALGKTDLNLRLGAMLKRTLPFIFESLDDHKSIARSSRLFPEKSSTSASSGSGERRGRGVLSVDAISLSPEGTALSSLAKGRVIVSVRYSHDRLQLLVAYGGSADGLHAGATESQKAWSSGEEGLIVIWDLSNDNQSGKALIFGLLICQCAVSCACWGPLGTNTICAGLTNGAIAVWDFADNRSTLRPATGDGWTDGTNAQFPFRVWRESATSEYLIDAKTSIAVVGKKVDITCSSHLDTNRREALAEVSNSRPGGRERVAGAAATPSLSLSFAVISTDEFLQIQVCSVSLLWNLDTVKAPLEGTRIGARVKIINVTDEINVGRRGGDTSSGLATCIQTIPGQSVQFVVGSTNGSLIRGARFGVPPAPRVWKPDLSETSTHDFDMCSAQVHDRTQGGVGVVHVAFSPFLPEIMAVAYDSGHVAIYSLRASQQMLLLSDYVAMGLSSIHWSPSCPSVLFVLDKLSTVHRHDIFDYHMTNNEEVFDTVVAASQSVRAANGASAVAITVSPADLSHLSVNGRQTVDDSEKTVAVTYDDGSVKMMMLEETTTEHIEEAVAKLSAALLREQF